MRQTLFRIWFDQPWAAWTHVEDDPPYLGAAWVWLVAGAMFLLVAYLRRDREILHSPAHWLLWLGGFIGIGLLGSMMPIAYLPVFGYGAMVLVGFLAGLLFAQHRGKQLGMNPELFMDLAFWLLITGVIGARTAHLIQYSDHVYADVKTPLQAIVATVNLSRGGLVLIGGLAAGTAGFFAFCRIYKLNALQLADVITPAVFIGEGFGRIGCLLNGCCFGDRCDLPWGIVFPVGSATFSELVARGFLDPAATGTFPLHPTQIYSSINGFLLALVTAQYFRYRVHDGDVFALGLVLYPITRFLMEFIRADEMGQLGTGMTISQIYCLGIIACGLGLMFRLRGRRLNPTGMVHGAAAAKATAIR